MQFLYKSGDMRTSAFTTWQPLLYVYVLWGIALGVGQVMTRGEDGYRALFVLPAVLFTVALVVFPTLFGFYIAATDWNLSSFAGRNFNGLDNFWQAVNDPFYRNALRQHGLLRALGVRGVRNRLRAGAPAQRADTRSKILSCRLPFAADAVAGRGHLDDRQVDDGEPLRPGRQLRALARLATIRRSSPTRGSPRFSIMAMDAWTFIPFLMIMLLAGLQAMPRDMSEAAKVDGATPWQSFWQVTFPLMLPVSVTAIILRIIFKLKLADIVITVTLRRAWRRDGHGIELHLSRVSRPLECRLRHDAGDGLSRSSSSCSSRCS